MEINNFEIIQRRRGDGQQFQVWDCRFVLRTPTLRAGSRFRIADRGKPKQTTVELIALRNLKCKKWDDPIFSNSIYIKSHLLFIFSIPQMFSCWQEMFIPYLESLPQHFVPRPQRPKVWIKGCNLQSDPPLFEFDDQSVKWWFFVFT